MRSFTRRFVQGAVSERTDLSTDGRPDALGDVRRHHADEDSFPADDEATLLLTNECRYASS